MTYNVYRINRKTGDKKIFRTCKSIVLAQKAWRQLTTKLAEEFRAQFGDILGLPAEEAFIEAA